MTRTLGLNRRRATILAAVAALAVPAALSAAEPPVSEPKPPPPAEYQPEAKRVPGAGARYFVAPYKDGGFGLWVIRTVRNPDGKFTYDYVPASEYPEQYGSFEIREEHLPEKVRKALVLEYGEQWEKINAKDDVVRVVVSGYLSSLTSAGPDTPVAATVVLGAVTIEGTKSRAGRILDTPITVELDLRVLSIRGLNPAPPTMDLPPQPRE